MSLIAVMLSRLVLMSILIFGAVGQDKIYILGGLLNITDKIYVHENYQYLSRIIKLSNMFSRSSKTFSATFNNTLLQLGVF